MFTDKKKTIKYFCPENKKEVETILYPIMPTNIVRYSSLIITKSKMDMCVCIENNVVLEIVDKSLWIKIYRIAQSETLYRMPRP